MFGKIAQAYFQQYGDQSDALAMIAAKNHKNGVANPYAQMRKDFGYEFCRSESEKNPFVAGPLEAHRLLAGVGRRRRPGADGCRDREDHGQGGQLPRHRACAGFPADVQARHLAVRGLHGGLAARAAEGRRALADLSFVETHDCFTIAELIEYEAMGLTPRGQGARAIKEGWTQKDGKLPVNPSGGLKAKGHPIGATGVSMHVMSAMQLAGEAPRACSSRTRKLAGIFNMGGAAVANYVSLLEPVK